MFSIINSFSSLWNAASHLPTRAVLWPTQDFNCSCKSHAESENVFCLRNPLWQAIFFWRGKETRLTVNTFCTMAWVPCSLWLVSPHSLNEPSFHEQYVCRLGKCSQTETGFKANFLLMKGDKSITSYALSWLLFQSAKIWGLVKKDIIFLKHRKDIYTFKGQWQWK